MRRLIITITISLFFQNGIAQNTSSIDCSHIYLPADTFYLSYPHDTVDAMMIYKNSILSSYGVAALTISDTSIIKAVNSFFVTGNPLQFPDDTITFLSFGIQFGTNAFSDSITINGLIHYYDSDVPGDSIVSCYLPIVFILLNDVTGANESLDDEEINIFPNPSVGEIIVRKLKSIKYDFIIYNTNGEKVFHNSINENNTETRFDLSQFSTGLYIAHLRSEKESRVKKFVKE